MLELANRYGEQPVLMSTVAESQKLSRKYLHALLTPLRSAGLVRSVRGARGGFVLARPPAQIKLSEVLHAVEGSLSLVDCVADPRVCDRSKRCPARRVWEALSGAVKDMLDHVTLEDMMAPEVKTCSESRREREERRSSKPSRNSKASSVPPRGR
ncbi:MAG: Rrf2 family transcriptional regulator [Phycisphaerales bacterium]|nr:MAG: Rrf2 family transcriptional regulator [Phycisphaerales bacterium]